VNDYRAALMSAVTIERVDRGFRRIRFMQPEDPWWCSLTCVCESCLDFDALITEHQLHTSARPLFTAPS
jgi:hypothetical protein